MNRKPLFPLAGYGIAAGTLTLVAPNITYFLVLLGLGFFLYSYYTPFRHSMAHVWIATSVVAHIGWFVTPDALSGYLALLPLLGLSACLSLPLLSHRFPILRREADAIETQRMLDGMAEYLRTNTAPVYAQFPPPVSSLRLYVTLHSLHTWRKPVFTLSSPDYPNKRLNGDFLNVYMRRFPHLSLLHWCPRVPLIEVVLPGESAHASLDRFANPLTSEVP